MVINNKRRGSVLQRIRKAWMKQYDGFTQADLAGHLGVTLNYISLAEKGDRGILNETLNRWCECLEIPVAIVELLATDSLQCGDWAGLIDGLIQNTESELASRGL